MIVDKLIDKIIEYDNPTVAGLDTSFVISPRKCAPG